jgi:Protein of unknown function (DUF3352)
MKSRNFFVTLGVTVSLLVLISVGLLYGILNQSPLNLLSGGVNNKPTGAMFVSKQAPAMVSLLVNPDRLESFRQLSAFPSQRRKAQAEIKQLENNLLAKTGLNYQKDIKPWLGEEISLAVTSLDYDRNQENGAQPGYLLILTTKDRELAKEFLQLSYSQQAISGNFDLSFQEYKGVNLTYQTPLKSKAKLTFPASAVVGNYVLFANDFSVLRDAINNAQAVDLNLANADFYQETLNSISTPKIALSFINLPALSAWIGNQTYSETPDIQQMLTVALSLQRQGLRAETALIGVSGQNNQKPVLSGLIEALNYVPRGSLLTIAGQDLNQFWTNIATGLAIDSPLQQLLKQFISRIEQPLGINLTEYIFSWVKGEYAVSLISDSETNKLNWVFIAEKLPEVNYQEAIAKLDEIASKQGLTTTELPLDENNITAWTKLTTNKKDKLVSIKTDVKGAHLNLEKYVIFSNSVELLSEAKLAKNNILASDKFNSAIIALPTENDGYFYLDWQQTQPFIEQKFPLIKVAEVAIEPLFKHLQSFTISSQGSENSIRRGTIFLNLS